MSDLLVALIYLASVGALWLVIHFVQTTEWGLKRASLPSFELVLARLFIVSAVAVVVAIPLSFVILVMMFLAPPLVIPPILFVAYWIFVSPFVSRSTLGETPPDEAERTRITSEVDSRKAGIDANGNQNPYISAAVTNSSAEDQMAHAIFVDNRQHVAKLLADGYQPNAKNAQGVSALKMAINCERHAIVELLRKAGAHE